MIFIAITNHHNADDSNEAPAVTSQLNQEKNQQFVTNAPATTTTTTTINNTTATTTITASTDKMISNSITTTSNNLHLFPPIAYQTADVLRVSRDDLAVPSSTPPPEKDYTPRREQTHPLPLVCAVHTSRRCVPNDSSPL